MGAFTMNKKHTYQLSIYADDGKFIKKAYVVFDIDLCSGQPKQDTFI